MTIIKIIMLLSFASMMWWRKNIIMLLLNLELLMISLFLLISFFYQLSSSISLMFLLVFMVSGSSIGLSLLVSLSRSQYSSNSIFLWSLIFVNHYLIYQINPFTQALYSWYSF